MLFVFQDDGDIIDETLSQGMLDATDDTANLHISSSSPQHFLPSTESLSGKNNSKNHSTSQSSTSQPTNSETCNVLVNRKPPFERKLSESISLESQIPSSPVMEYKVSNACSPFSKKSDDREYTRKCFFLPVQPKNIVEESDEDSDFDDSIISPTPRVKSVTAFHTLSEQASQTMIDSAPSTPDVKGMNSILRQMFSHNKRIRE